MTDQVLDPEKAMQRDLEKKRAVATQTIQVIKTEFIREYLKDFGELPDLTNPMINMFYNGWLAAQGDRQWHTPAELHEMKRRQIVNEKRKKTAWQNRDKRKGAR
jgi:hypothetical protein